ncbi:hypothetical protein SAMN05421805_103271 [Saccharopolyspora antimicrobica]|uniref:Uncharacterized protein n=1 Tax=Saccharopolyspora antimicrobica TaxID=455193 RepID=A0A1I4X6Y7_9PSEU|nr:hypothetical protein [Saccharopolyspora antimicrobica]RKT84344.1 hypothetical protein ATL45_2655 [Saccharopolyspora antimicrobica]SFN21462.1 hypothetical protein SAMN05421805_103271 [Saccharopolyspora antimicrobica]
MTIPMITATIAAVLVAFLVVHRVCSYRPQHAGGGDGALTVRYLIERVEAETSGGRHRLHEPDSGGRGSPDEAEQTSGFSRNTEVFQRVLAGLQRL